MGIQVEELTKDLMPWEKEYIDFSFNGHHISEYGLVAASSSDRYSFDGSPEFEDETSTINGVMGQYYWGTQIKTKKYEYNLATDGMTEEQFIDFKRLFRPGFYGQFYEDTWWDRYCYVRIESVMNFTFVPFLVEDTIAGVPIKTRIYKGECKLTLIQDKPFQFAYQHVLDSTIADLQATKNPNQQAAIRMMYHSNIPARDSWTQNFKCCIGANTVLKGGDKDDNNVSFSGDTISYYNPSTYDCENVIKFDLTHSTTAIDIETDGLWHPVYFNEINDEYNVEDDLDQIPYNVIGTSFPLVVGAAGDSEGQQLSRTFKYSLPETFEQINKAIKIAYDYWQLEEEGAAVSLEERLREELVNGKVMSWAISAIQIVMSYDGAQNSPQLYIPDDGEDKTGIGTFTTNTIDIYCGPINGNQKVSANWFGFFNVIMLCMFAEFQKNSEKTVGYDFTSDALLTTNFYDYTLTIDSELGICKVDYTYNSDILNGRQILIQTEENCSNIAMSEYLLLDGGDKLNKTNGKINTYHQLVFRRGNTPMNVKNAELKYKYTYM